MGCNCNEEQTPCGQKPCVPIKDCSCPVKDLSTDCVLYTGDDLECSGIKKGTILTDLIQQLDAYICDVRAELIRMFTIVNIGSGARWFKGVDALARKVFRTAVSTSPIITITESTDGNEVEFGIDETKLTDFVQTNQKTYSVENVGEGIGVYKDETVVGNNTQFNLRKIKSSTLSVMLSDDEESLEIETPSTASTPALYVNNLYIPTEAEFLAGNTKGEGTFAKPFTDTVTAYVAGVPTITANTAIQNALDAYVGDTGIYSRLNPQLSGQQIIVQDNSTSYTFNGDFNYTNLNLKIEGDINCTTTNWLVDMDNPLYFDSESSILTIEINEGINLSVSDTLGFRNSGNTSSTPPSYTDGRLCYLKGAGTIYSDYNGINVLTKYIFNGDGNNNDDGLHFQVECKVRAIYQGIYFCKNKMRIDFYNSIVSGILGVSVNTSLKAFHQTGGQVRFFNTSSIGISSEVSGRDYGMTFEPTDDGIGYTILQILSAPISGNCNYLFARLNNEHVQFNVFNSPSGEGFSTTIPGTPTIVNGLFENLGIAKWAVNFKNNIFSYTGIDFSKVDLTQGNGVSTTNFIGNNVIESLVIYDSKQSAKSAGLSTNSAFLKRVTVSAGNFEIGQEYRILTSGTPSIGTVGDYFTAVDNGSTYVGATAYLETREILI